MSIRSRSQRIGGLALAAALGAATLLGSVGTVGFAQEATPQVGSAEDLATENWTWPVEWVVDEEKQPAMYEPIDPASITKAWNICVSFPHLKDPVLARRQLRHRRGDPPRRRHDAAVRGRRLHRARHATQPDG